MRSRILVLVAAVALGVLAAVGAGRYLAAERARLVADNELVTVLVASQDLPSGMSADEVVDKRYLESREIPRQFVAAGAISSASALDGKVVASSVSKDEQITQARFKYPADVGLASSTPNGYLAISIPYEAARGVSGLIRPGDHVAVLGSFTGEGASDSDALTRIVIPKAKVLAVGKALQADQIQDPATTQASSGSLSGAGAAAQDGPATITLALPPDEAEKLVFAQEQGKVWLALYSPTDTATAKTAGVRYEQVAR